MALIGEELVGALLHGGPCGFMRVRHFGFLANRCRARRVRRHHKLTPKRHPTAPSEPPGCPVSAPSPLHAPDRNLPREPAAPIPGDTIPYTRPGSSPPGTVPGSD